jgi:hypothetical protein
VAVAGQDLVDVALQRDLQRFSSVGDVASTITRFDEWVVWVTMRYVAREIRAGKSVSAAAS